jgi:CheY-like chemotaxis protein
MKNQHPKKYNTVMLVDDNEIDNFIDEKLIKAFDFAENVYIHTSAKSALESLRNLSLTQNKLPEELIPHFLFLDINMPFLDGFNFLDEFGKLDDQITSKIKIVMLTSSVNPEDIEKSKKYPRVFKFIHKPLTEKILSQL